MNLKRTFPPRRPLEASVEIIHRINLGSIHRNEDVHAIDILRLRLTRLPRRGQQGTPPSAGFRQGRGAETELEASCWPARRAAGHPRRRLQLHGHDRLFSLRAGRGVERSCPAPGGHGAGGPVRTSFPRPRCPRSRLLAEPPASPCLRALGDDKLAGSSGIVKKAHGKVWRRGIKRSREAGPERGMLGIWGTAKLVPWLFRLLRC